MNTPTPEGEPRQDAVTLAECPPGLFWFGGTLGFKTEYGAMELVGPSDQPGPDLRWTVSNHPDAYCAESGEYFWGGTTNQRDRANLMVRPVLSRAALQPNPSQQGGAEALDPIWPNAVKAMLDRFDRAKGKGGYPTANEREAVRRCLAALNTQEARG